jgi:hypothetical protein
MHNHVAIEMLTLYIYTQCSGAYCTDSVLYGVSHGTMGRRLRLAIELFFVIWNAYIII